MWINGEVHTRLGFILSHHSCPECGCLRPGSCPAFLWGCREDLVLQWFPSGGTTSWAWESNSSARIEQHFRHPRASKAELADTRPIGGQCLSWESSGAPTGQTKMLKWFIFRLWGFWLHFRALAFCCYELMRVARNAGHCHTAVHGLQSIKHILKLSFFLLCSLPEA